jgi:hypothetical protein
MTKAKNNTSKTKAAKTIKPAKKVRIWWLKREGCGYWTDNPPDWIGEFQAMADGDVFTIERKELSQREFNKLAKNSGEFDGW